MLQNLLQRRLRMEMLEDKRPLAANLFANVVNGDLVITGDAGDNRFYIQSGSDGHQYEIGNLDDLNDITNISGVTRDIIINLGGGDDWINIRSKVGETVLEMPRDLKIDMGAGDDRLAFGMGDGPLFGFPIAPEAFPLDVARDLTINMGAGNDQSWMSSVTVGRDFSYTDSQGNASLVFMPTSSMGFFAVESATGRDFSVVTGGGADEIALEDISTGRNLLVSVDGGDDYLGVFNMNVAGSTLASLGSGIDFSEFQFSNLGLSLTVLGAGSSTIMLNSVTTSCAVTILTAKGDDAITLIDVCTSTAAITTGAGADQLEVIDSVFDNLLVTLDSGADTFIIGGTEVNCLALLSGGAGFDTLVNLGGNDFFLTLALAFESRVS